VVLRDYKYYVFINITKEQRPRVVLTRRIQKDGAAYFGPYSSAQSVRKTMHLLRRIFPFRGEKDSPHDIIFSHPLFAKDAGTSPASKTKANYIPRKTF
jgi:excinuclease UvrABC nuclease subunit